MDRDIARARIITGILLLCVVVVACHFASTVADWVQFTLGGW